jgi:hypothetical protein
MWEPRHLTIPWSSKACYRESKKNQITLELTPYSIKQQNNNNNNNNNNLFVVSLTKFLVIQNVWRRMRGWEWLMNWKGCGRKRLSPNLSCCTEISQERLKAPIKMPATTVRVRTKFHPGIVQIQTRNLEPSTIYLSRKFKWKFEVLNWVHNKICRRSYRKIRIKHNEERS